ncbi:hypothetical protein LVJ94_10175 [Pendulispora rubella]|uniref:Uncharacterized protein n=1 Tax=Pendulispora rubella TaxID=2741070 RepID=A0ABZ2L9I7_9BACT
MSTNETSSTVAIETPATENVAGEKKSPNTLVDIIFDLGTEWATYGLGLAKSALEQSAKTLEKLASSIDALKKQLASKA